MANEIISRAEAKARGLKLYFTGQPCLNGEIAERITRTWNCSCQKCRQNKSAVQMKNRDKQRHNETQRAYRAKAPERPREYTRQWRLKNTDRVSEYAKRYRQENKETVAAALRDWRLRNPHVTAEHNHLRRSAKACAVPSWYGEFDAFAIQEAADLARMRADLTGFAWHIDHMVPLRARSACGLHCATNIQVIPAAINVAKKNKMQLTEPGEWLR